MKRLNTLLLLLLAVQGLMAQTIPNGDMESWTTGTSGTTTYQDPTGWVTLNSQLASLGIVTVFKDSIDPHGGKYSAELKSASAVGIPVPAILLLGNLDVATQSYSGGVPFTDRPSSFSGAYQYTPAAGSHDSCFFIIAFTKWNSAKGQPDSVGGAVFSTGAATAGWNTFSVPIFYFNNNNPDTMLVLVTASNLAGGAAGTTLDVDDLGFSSASGIVPITDIYNLSYYPNPVRDQLNVVFTQYDKASLVNVYDLTGHLLQSVPVQGNIIPVKVESLPAGMYFFSVIAKDGSVLKTDKFNKVN